MITITNDVYTGLIKSASLGSEINMRFMAFMSQFGVLLRPTYGGTQSFSTDISTTVCAGQTFDSPLGELSTNLYIIYKVGNINSLTFKLSIIYAGKEYEEVLKTVYGNDAIKSTLFSINCARTGILNNVGLNNMFRRFYKSVSVGVI